MNILALDTSMGVCGAAVLLAGGDAQRTLLELRLQRIESAVAYHQFVIEIEKLLGEPLSPESAQSTQNSQP